MCLHSLILARARAVRVIVQNGKNQTFSLQYLNLDQIALVTYCGVTNYNKLSGLK